MPEGPRPVDLHVGQRLRLRRSLVGMSQESLAEHLGITYQQVQKYERGTNRIGSSRLHAIAQVLDVPIAWFFDGLPEARERDREVFEGSSSFVFNGPGATDSPEDVDRAAFSRETLELVRAFNRIGDPLVRRQLYELTKVLSAVKWR